MDAEDVAEKKWNMFEKAKKECGAIHFGEPNRLAQTLYHIDDDRDEDEQMRVALLSRR